MKLRYQTRGMVGGAYKLSLIIGVFRHIYRQFDMFVDSFHYRCNNHDNRDIFASQ